jgi:hypothetical protein
MQRREFLTWMGALTLLVQPWLLGAARSAETNLPAEVAGVRLPRSPLALRAVAFARSNCPDFLFNHSMRTFVFGALLLKLQHRSYRDEDAFVAAAFHDIGLLPAFETAKGSFEVDGADAVERWIHQNGGSKRQTDRAWYAVAPHDGVWELPLRQGPDSSATACERYNGGTQRPIMLIDAGKTAASPSPSAIRAPTSAGSESSAAGGVSSVNSDHHTTATPSTSLPP